MDDDTYDIKAKASGQDVIIGQDKSEEEKENA